MKNILLTAAIICLFSSFAFSQFQMDVSTGLTHLDTELSGIGNGFYASVTPVFPLKGKFNLRSTVQYRNLNNKFFNDKGNIDLSPELEYDVFKFLSIGAGVYYSFNLNSVLSSGSEFTSEFGPVGLVKFKLKDAFATIRFSKPIADELNDIFDTGSIDHEKAYFPGLFQFGLGYTFGKK